MFASRRAVLTAALGIPLLNRHASAQAKPQVLKFGLSTYPPSFEPWTQAGTSAATVKLAIHRGLLSYGPDGQIRGELAERWEQDGVGTWVFHLRSASFHNGAPVTSADVKWTFEQVMAPTSHAYLKGSLGIVDRVETPDERTVHFVMKQNVVTLPLLLASYHLPIVLKDSTASDPMGIGAGPYKIESLLRGEAINLTRFEGYYKPGLPRMVKIVMIPYQDDSLRTAALQTGTIDLMEYVPWPLMKSVNDDSHLRTDGTNGPFMYLTFNGATGPFKDTRVRQAVAFAIKREEIVQSAFYGFGAPLGGMPIPPDSPFHDPTHATFWHQDIDRSKMLLQQAGLADGFDCNLMLSATYAMYVATGTVVQQQLAAVGIRVTLRPVELGSFVTLGNRGQFDMAVVGNTADNNDPDGLESLIDVSLPPSFVRSFGLNIPRIRELLAAGRIEFNLEKRKKIYGELEAVVLNEAPLVTLCWRQQAYGMRREVQGFKNLPYELTFYSGITLEDVAFA